MFDVLPDIHLISQTCRILFYYFQVMSDSDSDAENEAEDQNASPPSPPPPQVIAYFKMKFN